MKNIALVTLGCAKNIVDSEVLIGGLKYSNFNIVKEIDNADSIIINTCGFIETAREESINTILEYEELKLNGKIKQLVVMGCLSERYKDELIEEFPNVDYFFGSNNHKEILSYLTGQAYQKDNPDFYRSLLTPSHYAYLKIAEGCDNGCSFCSIPIMRGLQKSQNPEVLVNEAKILVENGVKEIIVIAQDSTSYGWDLLPKSNLHNLFDKLNKIEGLEWLRLQYAHPAHLHSEMIKRFKDLDKLIPYIDMPVQHGSDKILKLMRRGLKSSGIKRKIEDLRKTNDKIAIRTTLIVGSPYETDKEFNELYDFVKEIEFDRLGVFTYSEEEGTYGAKSLQDNVPESIKNERKNQIMSLQQKINHSKNINLINSKQKVIVDLHTQDGWSLGRTYRDTPEVDNYVRIPAKVPVGEFYNVKIKDAHEYDLIGELEYVR